MKKNSIIILVFMIFLSVNAQFTMQSKEDFKKLKKTKTYVVLHDYNQNFNNTIRKAVEKNWKITPYEFISFKDLKNYSNSDKNSFLLVSDFGSRTIPSKAYSFYTEGYESKSGNAFEMKDNYMLSDGKWKNKSEMGISPTYGSTTLNIQIGGTKYFNSIKNWLGYVYAGFGNSSVNSSKLFPMINLIENLASLHLKGDEKDLKISSSDTFKIYNSENTLSNKTLVLLDTELPYYNNKNKKNFSIDDIKKSFTGKIILASDKEFNDIVDSGDKNMLFFGSYVEGTYSVVFLYDIEGKVHFIDKMGRFEVAESKGWYENALEKFEKAFKK